MRTTLRTLALVAALAIPAAVACSDDQPAPAPTNDAGAPSASPTNDATRGAPAVTTAARPGDMTTEQLVRFAESAIVRIQTESGVGSGVVVGADGFIVTNNHVITGNSGRLATDIRVTTSDGGVYPGKVVGADARSDLAVVRIEASNLKALDLASLANVAVGQDVVAIGYALDLKGGEGASFSVTRGIVSAKNRGIEESASILGAIQTDAAINHGNSGGPLLNLQGQIVGINTAVAPDRTTGGIASGIGFAVGSDTVKAVYEEIRANGKVQRGLLGILDFEALRPAKARDLGIPGNIGGVYLDSDSDVARGGPAAQAGLQGGDVIIRIGKYIINNESDLAVAMIHTKAGEKTELEVYRAGKKVALTVTVGAATQ